MKQHMHILTLLKAISAIHADILYPRRKIIARFEVDNIARVCADIKNLRDLPTQGVYLWG